eukprot:12095032-Alexandrium_andersonii.AAC.1
MQQLRTGRDVNALGAATARPDAGFQSSGRQLWSVRCASAAQSWPSGVTQSMLGPSPPSHRPFGRPKG